MAPEETVLENGPGATRPIHLTVNGKGCALEVGEGHGRVSPSHTLAHTLRETLGLTGTKVSCDHGACGACTVIMDGKPILSCMTLTVECDGKTILTIEGIEGPQNGRARPAPAAVRRAYRLSVRLLHAWA